MTAGLLDGKVAIVTGVSSGVGRGVAKVFARRGAAVVGTARRAELGEALADELSAGEFAFVRADVSDAGDCERVVDLALDRHGHVEVLVNNAGVTGPVAPASEVDEREWDTVLDINLKGTFLMCQAVLPHMRARRDGTILNIASINAVIGVADMIAYNASKAAVVQLSRTLAVENVARNVRVNAIVLGGVASESNEAVALRMGRLRHGEDWMPHHAEARGLMSPEAVGRALTLLCTDDAAPITGGAIPIDRAATAGVLASSFIHLHSAELLD